MHGYTNPALSDQRWRLGEDRRRIPRASVHWTVHIAGHGFTHPYSTKTRDISRDGFYCLLDRPLTPGERIECDIVVPTYSALGRCDVMHLRCSVVVVRVEQTGSEPEFGVACRIEDYRIAHGETDSNLKCTVSGVIGPK